MDTLFVGIADISFSCRGGELVVVSPTQELAEAKLLKAWNAEFRAYGNKPLKTFKDLNEWNGARVRAISANKAVIW